MLQRRVIPTLLLQGDALVKTTQFRSPAYIGDPCNTVEIFNEMEVDELVFLDISSNRHRNGPNFGLLENIASECFMPLAYGGGISDVEQAEKLFKIGFEKVIINTAGVKNPQLLYQLSERFGSQAVVAAVDYRRNRKGKGELHIESGQTNTHQDVLKWCTEVENLGAGEILLTSIDQEGTWSGFDKDLAQKVALNSDVPVIVHGGAGSLEDIYELFKETKASAVGIGSYFVFQKQGMGVLVNMPTRAEMKSMLDKSNG
jgi:cyclase